MMSQDSEPDSAAAANPLRASNAERETAVQALGAHYADGRLDKAELDDRVAAALAARTHGELDALFADLPGPAPTTRTGQSRAGELTLPAPAGIRRIPALLIVALLLVLAATGGLHAIAAIPLFVMLSLGRRARRAGQTARPPT